MVEINDTIGDKENNMLGGAKMKNGHKASCSCHICNNIKNKAKRGGYAEDAEKAALNRAGGSKKKNGHTPTCACPICKNMKNAKKNKRGGDGDYIEKDEQVDVDEETVVEGGGKTRRHNKKNGNGHKSRCGCPICKNMKKKSRKGGSDTNSLLLNSSSSSMSGENTVENAADDEYDKIDAVQNAGTRKRRGKRNSNGHKIDCRCPICMNMRRSKKTRRNKKHRQ
jgi:hypothetical protein